MIVDSRLRSCYGPRNQVPESPLAQCGGDVAGDIEIAGDVRVASHIQFVYPRVRPNADIAGGVPDAGSGKVCICAKCLRTCPNIGIA